MKRLLLAMICVFLFASASMAYGGGKHIEDWDFSQDFSIRYRNKTIEMGYWPGWVEPIGNGYYWNYSARTYVGAVMDNSLGGVNVITAIRCSDGVIKTGGKASQLTKNQQFVTVQQGSTTRAIWLYDYIDYRGASTAPDIYELELR